MVIWIVARGPLYWRRWRRKIESSRLIKGVSLREARGLALLIKDAAALIAAIVRGLIGKAVVEIAVGAR